MRSRGNLPDSARMTALSRVMEWSEDAKSFRVLRGPQTSRHAQRAGGLIAGSLAPPVTAGSRVHRFAEGEVCAPHGLRLRPHPASTRCPGVAVPGLAGDGKPRGLQAIGAGVPIPAGAPVFPSGLFRSAVGARPYALALAPTLLRTLERAFGPLRNPRAVPCSDGCPPCAAPSESVRPPARFLRVRLCAAQPLSLHLPAVCSALSWSVMRWY